MPGRADLPHPQAYLFQPTVTALALFTKFIQWNMAFDHSKTVGFCKIPKCL